MAGDGEVERVVCQCGPGGFHPGDCAALVEDGFDFATEETSPAVQEDELWAAGAFAAEIVVGGALLAALRRIAVVTRDPVLDGEGLIERRCFLCFRQAKRAAIAVVGELSELGTCDVAVVYEWPCLNLRGCNGRDWRRRSLCTSSRRPSG